MRNARVSEFGWLCASVQVNITAMGLSVYEAAMIARLAETLPRRNTVVCLGVPTLRFTTDQLQRWCQRLGVAWDRGPLAGKTVLTASTFFRSLGFANCLSMDIAKYEGAEIIHDLNCSDLPEASMGIADCVFNAGTLEHVFHLPNALAVVCKLLAQSGMAIHIAPSNGYLDHGFYQFSPTLLFDYYCANHFRIVSANLINRFPRLHCEPYSEDVYRRRSPWYGVKRMPRSTVFFAVAKTPSSTFDQVPMQSFYGELHRSTSRTEENEHPFEFDEPFDLRHFLWRSLSPVLRGLRQVRTRT